MKKKYNIALLPKNKNKTFIHLANQLNEIVHQYQLGENSLPHVTLCHFYAEPEEIRAYWEKTTKALPQKTIALDFAKTSFLTLNNTIYWIALIPEPTQCQALHAMHLTVAEIIKNPVNRSYQHYDPHLTLINTKFKDASGYIKKLAIAENPIHDDFILSLGESDEIGQYIEVVNCA